MFSRPGQGGEDVLDGCGIRVLWGETEVNGEKG